MAEPGPHGDPFAALGLPARAGLSDEDVRAAWRRIAAATHPDREDGGDPARFGAAAAAYVTLRTDFGRGEALADRERGERGSVRRGTAGRGSAMPRFRAGASLAGSGARLEAGVVLAASAAAGIAGGGRARGLVARGLAAGAVSTVAFLAAGWSPGTVGVLAGALSWLVIAGLRL